jgi:hypothetical protein
MPRKYRLSYFTKGTGASVEPLDEPGVGRSEEERRAARRAPKRRRATSRSRSDDGWPKRDATTPRERRSTPLPPGHVRKKATGEIGRVQSVDSRAGTVSVLWLKQGRTSTVPIAAVSRR